MLIKVYLYCLFPLTDWFTRSLGAEFITVHALLCVCLKKEGGGDRGGARFSDMFCK